MKDDNYVLNNKNIMEFAKGGKMKKAMDEYCKNSLIFLNKLNVSIFDYVSGKTNQDDNW